MPGLAAISATLPASISAASSGVTSSAATSTRGARFKRSRVLTAASSPPPVTSGGLPSKLTRIGKVRNRLSSYRHAFRRLIGEALRRKLDFEPVEFFRHDDLAAKPRALIDVEGAVEHLELFAARGAEFSHPILADPDMARGAGASAAALGLDRQAPIADHLHDAPAFERLKAMSRAIGQTQVEEHVRPPCAKLLKPANSLEYSEKSFSQTGSYSKKTQNRFDWAYLIVFFCAIGIRRNVSIGPMDHREKSLPCLRFRAAGF